MNGSTDPSGESPAPPARFIIIPMFIWVALSRDELTVYTCLAAHADERGYSWPSHATIAAETGLSASTVKRALASMMGRDGFKAVKRKRADGGQASNGYFIPLHNTAP